MNTSTALPRLAVGAAAATGLAATANAQFEGIFDNTPPTRGTYNYGSATSVSFGQWTFSNTTSTAPFFSQLVNTSDSNAVTLSSTSFTFPSANFAYIDFTLPVSAEGTISFDFSYPDFGQADAFAGYTTDGSTWVPFGTSSASSFAVAVSPGDVFGFRVGDNYLNFNNSSLSISSISFTAIPEPGSFGLVASIASLGYVGLIASRRRRQRAALAA
jgi:hypothetical protein